MAPRFGDFRPLQGRYNQNMEDAEVVRTASLSTIRALARRTRQPLLENDMEPTFFAQYKGFEFHCSPERLNGGGFVPRLLVSADYGASEVAIPVPVQGPPYLDATEAAHRSFWQGRRWVDSGGAPPHATAPSLAFTPSPGIA